MRYGIIVLCILLPLSGFARRNLIETRNQYEGRTLETWYGENSREYREEGVERLLVYLDRQGREREWEYWYQRDFIVTNGLYRKQVLWDGAGIRYREIFTYSPAWGETKGYRQYTVNYRNGQYRTDDEMIMSPLTTSNQGYARRLNFYLQDNEREIMERTKYYYSDDFTHRTGITAGVTFYNKKGGIDRNEFFFTDDWAADKGYARQVEFYNPKGFLVRVEYYAKEGAVVNTIYYK